jgi:6-pyruvoyltetrahydropterin/6-carboxytetrahydropterin synthase
VFEVSYQTGFCATHRLTDRGQPIEPNHGHDWKVEAVAAGEGLDHLGVVLDFERLKDVLGEVAQRFHYKDLNQDPAFAGQSTSAEVVARYIFQEVKKGLGKEGRLLRRVQVWEAPGCSATYLE